jgi:hypothetical protein
MIWPEAKYHLLDIKAQINENLNETVFFEPYYKAAIILQLMPAFSCNASCNEVIKIYYEK